MIAIQHRPNITQSACWFLRIIQTNEQRQRLGSNAWTKLWKVHHLSKGGALQRNDHADGFPCASMRVLGVKEMRLGSDKYTSKKHSVIRRYLINVVLFPELRSLLLEEGCVLCGLFRNIWIRFNLNI